MLGRLLLLPGQHQLDPVSREFGHDSLGAVVSGLPHVLVAVTKAEKEVRLKKIICKIAKKCLTRFETLNIDEQNFHKLCYKKIKSALNLRSQPINEKTEEILKVFQAFYFGGQSNRGKAFFTEENCVEENCVEENSVEKYDLFSFVVNRSDQNEKYNRSLTLAKKSKIFMESKMEIWN